MFSDNNAVYLVTAYGVFFGGMLVYALSLLARRATLRRDERELAEYEKEKI